jgi:hypothetical protein
MFADFLKALHGLICDYKYYESVKKMPELSLIKTDICGQCVTLQALPSAG